MNVFAYRHGTQDPHVIKHVLDENSYRLPDSFSEDDIIIDLGANIGCFAAACLARGAGHVECYELEEENYKLLKRNMAYYGDRVQCYQRAVWRSDEQTTALYINNHHDYTAMHHVFDGAGKLAVTIGLDRILEPHEQVDLLKIDIEGSEFPVLYTSKLLGRVKRIIGEIHPAFVFDDWDSTAEGVKSYLEKLGFEVELRPSADEGLAIEFDAVQLAGVYV